MKPCSTKTRPCSTKTKMCAGKAFSDSAFNQFPNLRSTKTKPFCFSKDVVNRSTFYLLKDIVKSVTFSKETMPFNGVLQDTRFVKQRPRVIPPCSDSAFNQDEAVFNQDQGVCSYGVFQFRAKPRPSDVVCGQQERHREKKQKA